MSTPDASTNIQNKSGNDMKNDSSVTSKRGEKRSRKQLEYSDSDSSEYSSSDSSDDEYSSSDGETSSESKKVHRSNNVKKAPPKRRRKQDYNDAQPPIIIITSMAASGESVDDSSGNSHASESGKYRDSLPEKEKEWLKKEEKKVYAFGKQRIPPREKILRSSMSLSAKYKVLSTMDQLSNMSSYSSEYSKLITWMDGVMNIPFGKFVNLPVSLTSRNDEISSYLNGIQQTMNNCIYGQTKAKNAILECVGSWITNPSTTTTPIAFVGEKGTGKTTLARHGIAAALGRPFFMVSLGGESDAGSFKGHDYTYEGSRWGRIADILMQTKCMNPVIFFDELDKLSETKQGEEIAGMLIHLTDTTQNSSFTDKYFAGIELDLSKALFIFSYNYPEKVHPILRDRITEIEFDRFSVSDKTQIVKQFLLPRICANIGLREEQFHLPDTTIEQLIRRYCSSEAGVRDIKKLLETIFKRLNLLQLPQQLEVPYGNAVTKNKKDDTQQINKIHITPKTAEKLLLGYASSSDLPMSVQMFYT